MPRDDLRILYHELCETRFACVPRGEHSLLDIYGFVREHYPALCDDSYLCSENCTSGHNSPEWQHRVRAALSYLKKHGRDVQSGAEGAVWVFGQIPENVDFQLTAVDDEAPSPERIPTMTLRVVRDTALAQRIKRLHEYRCQLCGLAIELPEGTLYAEAHHLQPLGNPHNDPDVAENIIVLCPNHHAMCDFGVITLESEELRSHPDHVIRTDFLDYHNDVVAGWL